MQGGTQPPSGVSDAAGGGCGGAAVSSASTSGLTIAAHLQPAQQPVPATAEPEAPKADEIGEEETQRAGAVEAAEEGPGHSEDEENEDQDDDDWMEEGEGFAAARRSAAAREAQTFEAREALRLRHLQRGISGTSDAPERDS